MNQNIFDVLNKAMCLNQLNFSLGEVIQNDMTEIESKHLTKYKSRLERFDLSLVSLLQLVKV